jgi:predicted RNA-binding protein with PUA-like domain
MQREGRMNRWLVKGDPEDYSAADLERERRTVWSGVKNPAAIAHLRAMTVGDEVLVYHTGGEKSVVALARVAVGPRADAGDRTGKLVVVDLEFVRWLKKPVALAAIKAEPAFADFLLVRIGRLSVMPVTPAQWKRLMELARE